MSRTGSGRTTLRIGLTGGIACGKTRVLERLAAAGLGAIDLDAVAHEAIAPGGPAHAAVVAAFGRDLLRSDGSVDRRALGAVVFADASARGRLEAIVHPWVRELELARVRSLEAAGRPVVVSDAALLVETGSHLRFDRLIVVRCAPEQQQRRLMLRDGLTEGAAAARIAAQMPVQEKARFAHLEIDATGAPERTDAAADALAVRLLALAALHRSRSTLQPDAVLAALRCGGGAGPRGLSPVRLLEVLLESGGVELRRLAGALAPAAAGPWYRAARPDEGPPWPEALAVPLALWTVHDGRDREWLSAAAASIARLTHVEGDAVSGAVLAALAAHAVVRGEGPASLPDRLHGWAAEAMRWGDALPASRVERAVEAAARSTGDCVEARRRADETRAEPGLAGGLVGLASGRSPAGEPDPGLVRLAQRLGR